jgi:hypothetical protein
MSCVYKLKFFKSPESLNEDYEMLSDIDKARIFNMVAESVFEFRENGVYCFYVIVEPSELNPYLGILNENFIKYEMSNISSDILSGAFDTDLIKDDISFDNEVKYLNFIEDLDDWILNNLDIDTILDKISSYGMRSLKEVELEFLKNNNI